MKIYRRRTSPHRSMQHGETAAAKWNSAFIRCYYLQLLFLLWHAGTSSEGKNKKAPHFHKGHLAEQRRKKITFWNLKEKNATRAPAAACGPVSAFTGNVLLVRNEQGAYGGARTPGGNSLHTASPRSSRCLNCLLTGSVVVSINLFLGQMSTY